MVYNELKFTELSQVSVEGLCFDGDKSDVEIYLSVRKAENVKVNSLALYLQKKKLMEVY
jgi:hypothetical protein